MFFDILVKIGNFQIPLYILIFIPIGLIFLFLLWKEGVKDGFDKEKLFDLYFLNIIVWLFLSFLIRYIWKYTQFYEIYRYDLYIGAFYISNLFLIRYFTFILKWSVYRILDIFSILYFLVSFTIFGSFIIKNFHLWQALLFVLYVFVYLAVYINKNRIFSSVAFSLVFLLIPSFSMFVLGDYVHLLFYFSLITISMLTLIFRSRKKMFNKNINIDFINKIKSFLKTKNNRLENEQQKLIEEDPYLKEGRALGNSEEMDEAILEDRAKEELDIKKESIEDMQKQIGKALDKIEKGDYGICEKCKNPIDKARLEAYPEATMCLDCADNENE